MGFNLPILIRIRRMLAASLAQSVTIFARDDTAILDRANATIERRTV